MAETTMQTQDNNTPLDWAATLVSMLRASISWEQWLVGRVMTSR